MMREVIALTELTSPIGGINSVVDNLHLLFRYKVVTAYRAKTIQLTLVSVFALIIIKILLLNI